MYGYISNEFLLLFPPFINQVLFGVFWFWVGMRFASLQGNHIKNIFIGNSIWLISFLLFIWQFVLVNDENRNLFFALLSQYYQFSFLWSGTKITVVLSETIYSTMIMTLSYILMFIVFMAGYITKAYRLRKMRGNIL